MILELMIELMVGAWTDTANTMSYGVTVCLDKHIKCRRMPMIAFECMIIGHYRLDTDWVGNL